MWQNDSFAGNGVGNFLASNGNQNNLSSPFTASSPSGSQFTQHSYQPSVNENLHMTGTNCQPEPGSYSGNNTDAFGRNTSQYRSDTQFSPPQYSAPTTPSTSGPTTSLPDLNSRAAELKAKLIQNKIRQGSTPPIHISKSAVNSLSNIPSPSTPAADIGASVTDLIKEFSGSAEQITHAQSPKNNGIQAISKAVDKAAKSHTTSLGSPAKVSKPEGNNGTQIGKTVARKRTSNGSLSEASEGEIIEDDLSEKQTKPTLAQSIRNQPPKNSKNEEPAQIEVWDSLSLKQSSSYYSRPENSAHQGSSDNIRSLPRHVRTDEPQNNVYDPPNRRSSLSEIRSNDISQNSYQADRIRNEIRKTEIIKDSKRDDSLKIRQEPHKSVVREANPPTLDQVLPHNPDLREWLDITGYHITDYRDKVLSRRRKIAALDAQKAQLLAEEIGERGGHPGTSGALALPAAMLPPPVPSQPAPIITRTDTAPKSEIIASPSERGIKRPRSAERVEARPENKVPRAGIEDQGFGDRRRSDIYQSRSRSPPRIKHEDDIGITRDSRQYDSYRARDGDRDFEDRGRGARYGRDGRDFSPDRIRPFESHGVYKGRAYDPNYATRGRGRGGRARGDVAGRGDIQGPIDYDRDRDEGFGSRIANGQPYRDRKGFNRGGKGDTRYFIVKSFNEENVLKCIEDSIWTTQVQNGDIFAEAFKTCKNVILVFSINKSRAFQGYARMESVPGSITPPDWQKAINWESAGAFRVRWIVVCSTRFHRIGHLKNALNDNQAVLIGKDGQEIEENCAMGLIELIDEEVDMALANWRRGDRAWDD